MASSAAGPSSRSVKPPVVQPSSGNAIIINPCQRLNPLLECIRNVNKEFGDIVSDFQLGRTTCALFLSLKYHRLHPEYIHQRIQKLGHLFTLRLLILICDVNEHQEPIRELTKICLINNITIIVCWSNEEAGMYLATYKLFEHKPPDLIKERVEREYGAMLRAALTSINRVNKTDVESLRTSFGSFARIARATPEELRRLPGFGQVKVRRVVDAFEKPFRNKSTSVLPSQAQAGAQLQPQYQRQKDITEQDEQELLVVEDRRLERRTKETPGRDAELAASKSNPSQDTTMSTPSAKRVHEFGSAANMPTPPPASTGRTPREPSPVWDIELDLNDDDLRDAGVDVDPRLAKKVGAGVGTGVDEPVTNGGGVRGDDGDDKRNKEEHEQEQRQRQRSPSPVWDIELDLNDDEL